MKDRRSPEPQRPPRPPRPQSVFSLRARPAADEELADDPVELVRALELRHVAAVVDDHLARAGNRPLEPIGAGWIRELVVLAPADERRRLDRSDLLLRQAAAVAGFLHLRDGERRA